MNKKKELAKNAVILTVGKICTQFVSFLLLPLYTALLSPDEYGIVDLFNTYITLLVPIFNWQFENGLFRFMIDVRGKKDGQKELFTTVLIANFVQIMLYLLLFIIFQPFIHSEYKIFLAIDVALNILLNTMLQFPRGLGNNIVYAFGSFLSASTTVVFNVILIAGLRLGATGMFLATVVAKIVTVIYLIIASKAWEYFSIKSFKYDLLKKVTSYSVPLIPNSLSWWIIGASDRTIVSFVIGTAANGIYSVANKFSSVYSTFFSIFNLSWTESVSVHLNDEDRDVFLTETINDMFRLFSAVCFGIIAYMPLFFPLLVNEKYEASYDQIPILMIAILFQVVMGLVSVIYVALKMSKELAKSTVYAAIINVVVDVILIRYIGLYAASLSTLIAFAFVAIYRYYDIKRFVSFQFDRTLIILTLVVGAADLLLYYYNHLATNIILALGITVYAVIINRSFLRSILNSGLQFIRNRKNNE